MDFDTSPSEIRSTKTQRGCAATCHAGSCEQNDRSSLLKILFEQQTPAEMPICFRAQRWVPEIWCLAC